jgi:predicted dithiol-disulfide oxidoreductase (DUF899 family)
VFCPGCVSTLALVAAGTTSSAGLSAFVVSLRRRARVAAAAPNPTPESSMEQSTVVSREEWLTARRALLAKEKEATRLRDALSAQRRALPMVRVEKAYTFEGPGGPVTLRDLFGPHRQLVVYHFMFAPAWEEGCKSCSYVMDNVEGALMHLAAADTAFAAVARAPLAKIEAFKARMGWRFPWLSSGETDFNYDFHVTLDDGRGSVEYNYEPATELRRRGEIPQAPGDLPGFSVFLRDGDDVFHTYSTYQRGVDLFLNTYNLLDLTPLGRGEQRPMQWVRYHDRYEG